MTRPLTPCRIPGCPAVAITRGYCQRHQPTPTPQHLGDRGTTTHQGYGWAWQQQRDAFLKENPYCIMCLAQGREVAATVVDHILSRRLGGEDDPSNYQALCQHHHNRKRGHEGGAVKSLGS